MPHAAAVLLRRVLNAMLAEGVGRGLRGPYDVVEDPLYDYWRPWEYLVIPLPPKVCVSGEKAETVAGDRIHNVLVARRDAFGSALLSRIADRRAVFPATAMPSNRFKTGLRDRGADDDVIGVYHWTPMSRWVWVVEVIDHDAWDTGAPSGDRRGAHRRHRPHR